MLIAPVHDWNLNIWEPLVLSKPEIVKTLILAVLTRDARSHVIWQSHPLIIMITIHTCTLQFKMIWIIFCFSLIYNPTKCHKIMKGPFYNIYLLNIRLNLATTNTFITWQCHLELMFYMIFHFPVKPIKPVFLVSLVHKVSSFEFKLLYAWVNAWKL